jgi:hypothetical protein
MFKELLFLIKLFFKKVDYSKTELPIIKMKHFPGKNYSAMMWCGYLIDNGSCEIIQEIKDHEMIHYKQMCAMGSYFKYYLIYILEWLKLGFFSYSIYYAHPFEIEAHVNDINPNYETYKGKWKKYRLKHGRRLYRENMYNWKSFIRDYFKHIV